jgi:signal transduction histidine kinase
MTSDLSPLRRIVRAGPFTRRTARELVYLVATTLIASVAAVAAWATIVTAPFIAITVILLPVLALVVIFELRMARRLAGLQRRLAARSLDLDVAGPPPFRRQPGLWGWFRSSLTDVDGWRAVAFLVATFPAKAVAVWATFVGWRAGLTWATYPVWWSALDPHQTDAAGMRHHAGVSFDYWFADTVLEALLVAVLGIAVLWAVVWVARGLAALDRGAIRWLLTPREADRRLAEAEEQRAHAVEDAAATLRRIERDLHDGTQARLVAVAMQLDMAREQLAVAAAIAGEDGAPELGEAQALLDTAHRNATDAITELREVTRSIHPPALDVGLDTALATLAARSAVPVHLRTDLPRRPSAPVETIAYYCVAELLTNVAKHSGARTAWVDAVEHGDRLELRVTDDGAGGASLAGGRGLAGLADRVATVDGRLSVHSPPGGPTVATVELPVGS